MSLSYNDRKSIACKVIPSMINIGLSANEGLRLYQLIGFGIRRKVWLELWREITNPDPLRLVSTDH